MIYMSKSERWDHNKGSDHCYVLFSSKYTKWLGKLRNLTRPILMGEALACITTNFEHWWYEWSEKNITINRNLQRLLNIPRCTWLKQEQITKCVQQLGRATGKAEIRDLIHYLQDVHRIESIILEV